MSAFGTKRIFRGWVPMSALGVKRILFDRRYTRQKSLNRVGDSSVYRTVC
jgi:hypothetical protein